MKKFILFLPLLFLLACNSEVPENEDAAPTTATISGKIENPKGTVVIANVDGKTEAQVDAEGNFNLTLEIDKPGLYRFSHGGERTSIFLEPNDNITVSLNSEEFDESLKYAGTGAEENNYLASKFILEEQLSGDYSEIYSVSEEDFLAVMAEKESKLHANLKDHLKKAEMNTDFVAEQKFDIQFTYAMKKSNFENYHKYFTKKEDFKVSENYYAFQNELPMNDDALINVGAFKEYFGNLIRNKSETALEGDFEYAELTEEAMKIIPTLSDNQEIRDYGFYKMMKDLVTYEGTNFPKEIMNDFKANCKNEEYLTEVDEVYASWAKLAKGEKAPNFAYQNLQNENIGLADLKGKYVYIDVWATWCGPCRAEHPHFEKLQDEYAANKNVVFAGISIDKDKTAWAKWVQEKEMKGVQLIADKAWDSSICKDYMIKGIPRFILIDPEGNILNANAPRPSSDKIKMILKDISKPVLTSMK